MDDMHMVQLLPDDMLAAILRRLDSPRRIAVSRCVCKAWRAVVDAHRLLRTDLLPFSLAGIFVGLDYQTLPEYFAPPPVSSSTKIAAKFDYLDTDDVESLTIAQHCNGLLLLDGLAVLNPATRRWTRLPSPPPLSLLVAHGKVEREDAHLVFDPTLSSHYEVFLINSLQFRPCPDFRQLLDRPTQALEWPPSPYTMRVFSSRTGRWELKSFVREGEAAGTVEDIISFPSCKPWYAAYSTGALYLQHRDFVMRITLSNNKYQIIKLPRDPRVSIEDTAHYLGKSEKGVYCACYGYDGFGLRVWFLDESCVPMKWVLKRDINLKLLLSNFPWKCSNRPWTVQYANYVEDDRSQAPVGQDIEWDFDNDNVIDTEDGSTESYQDTSVESYQDMFYISLLGFHPNKEIVFFHTPSKRVVAYHFSSSKVKDLGCLPTKNTVIYCSFPYTPCQVG